MRGPRRRTLRLHLMKTTDGSVPVRLRVVAQGTPGRTPRPAPWRFGLGPMRRTPIATGTPPGVGMGQKPDPVYLRPARDSLLVA